MSVINKMLNDLQSRDSTQGPIQADYVPPKKNRLRIGIYTGLIILVIMLAVLLYWPSWVKQSGSIPQAPVQAPKTPTEPIQQARLTQANTSQINQAEVNQSDEPDEGLENVSEQPLASNAALPSVEQDVASVEQKAPPIEDTSNQLSAVLESPSNVDQIDNLDSENGPGDIPKFKMVRTDAAQALAGLKQNLATAIAEGDNFAAIDLLTQLLKLEPSNVNARKKLASIYFSRGKYALAKSLLVVGVEQFPERNDFRLMLSRIDLVKQDQASAFTWLEGVLVENADQELLDMRASLAQQLGKLQLAANDYQLLVDLTPDNAKWWLGLGTVRDQLGQTELAVMAYRKVLELDLLSPQVNEFVLQRIALLSEEQ